LEIGDVVEQTAPGTEGDIMNDERLERSLNSIGKACFVKHYETLRDWSGIDAVEYLIKHELYTEDAARVRGSCSKNIFNAGRHADALRIIARSDRVPREVVAKAETLLSE
jgi:hypothetical protein